MRRSFKAGSADNQHHGVSRVAASGERVVGGRVGGWIAAWFGGCAWLMGRCEGKRADLQVGGLADGVCGAAGVIG